MKEKASKGGNTSRLDLNPQSQFARLADLLPEAMLLVSGDGVILASNRSLAALTGLSLAELVGLQLTTITTEPSAVVMSRLRSWSRSNSLAPASLTLVGNDNQATPCRCEGAVVTVRSAHTPAVILVRLLRKEAAVSRFITLNQRIDELTNEVTRRRRAEKALDAQREWLHVTLQGIGDAVIAVDSSERITFINPAACTLTGWALEDAIGTPLEDVFQIINEQSRAKAESPVAKVLHQGRTVGLANHTVLIRKDGTELAIDDSAAPIRGSDGNMLGVVLVFHDVTLRRMLERDLRERTEKLAEADRRKDEFLAMLAHELRNPMAPLLTGSHVLRSLYSSDERIQSLGDMMERQVQHLSRLVDDLLDVSRITRGKIELHRRPMPLHSALERAVEMTDPLMSKRNHVLTVLMPPPSVCVDADATRLAQVFGNLLENAAKFTDPDGQISLTAEVLDQEAVVRVKDNGVGIEAAMLPKVFDLFAQVDKSLDRTRGGLGLGLTVVKNLVEMHDGTVEVHSNGSNQGSEFVVRLPTLPESEATVAPGHARSLSPAASVTARRVLVVDDNKDAAVSLAMLIRGWNHDVRWVHSGPEALALGATFRPELILLDIGLPEMDGYAVARELRKQAETAGSQLIALTGYGSEEDRRLALAAGFDGHLIKPVALDRLEALLQVGE